ncbi:MAG: hypothetical protein OIF32_11540 [Campylobacterales bacterium]|nr:hypothetical protein [Campylobacterales bacterium]
MNSIKLRKLSEKARKYLTTGSSQSQFNIESLKTIENEIDINIDKISKEEIDEFFDIYLGHNFQSFLNPSKSEKLIYEFLSPYLLREKFVTKELTEVKSIKREVQREKNIQEEELEKINKKLFSRFFYKKKINEIKDNIDYINIILSQLQQAEVRRQRWGIDMLIGDFYVVYKTCLYILYYGKTQNILFLEQHITKAIEDLIITIENSIMNYPFKKRKDIKKYITGLLENISEHKLKEVSVKIEEEASNNIFSIG